MFLIDPTGWAQVEGEVFAPGGFCDTRRSASGRA
jgi:hypothetical protein